MRGLLAEGFSLSDQNHADTGFQRNVQYFFNRRNLFILFHKKRTGKLLCLYLQVYGTMIALFYIRINVSVQDPASDIVCYINIIDSPAFIIQSHGRETLAPPTVPVRFRMFYAKAVCPPAVQKFIHPGSFGG